MAMRYRFSCAALVAVFIALSATLAGAQCVTGTVTAEFQTSGPFNNLWKYTAVVTWDTNQGLSNVTLECGFGACPEQACAQTYLFDAPGGTSDGTTGPPNPQPCVAEYVGEFNCGGNPSIGWTDPVIKWDAVNGGCEPEKVGTATLCFYTNLGPSENSQLPIVLIKNGTSVCEGTLTGQCPAAPCSVPVEETNWGQVKAGFEK